MDSHTQERAAPVKAPIVVSSTRVRPCSSKMLTTYLADIEQMLDEQTWDAALREATDLPSIAVALADPQLRSSSETIQRWFADWVRPNQTDGDSRGLDFERTSKALLSRVLTADAKEGVPAKALRRFRLRRLARTPPTRFAPERARLPDSVGKDAADMCKVVAEGVRRWYAHAGCSDPIVQANLGRLAVLR
jgi:hypothetical protein